MLPSNRTRRSFCRKGYLITALLLGAVAAGPQRAEAAEVAGERLPRSLLADGQQLALAGCAPRQVLWKDIYALGLYLPGPGTTADRLRDPATAKAALVKVAYEGEVPDEPPQEWEEQLRQAASEEVVQTFRRHYRTVEPGDAITITYTPERGTTIQLNDEPIISEPGHQLMDALLGMWVGRNPVSEGMRDELLAGSC
jgi:hypothetical protein